MADDIDEARIIAWLDGELPPDEAEKVERAVAAEPALHRLADRHRAMKARFTAAFGPIAGESVPLPPAAPVISLDAVRAARTARKAASPRSARPWAVPTAIAASLMLGFLVGQVERTPGGVGDRAEALLISPPLSHQLDQQLSGDAGPVRIGLSFRDHQGTYCRSFTATHLAGVACRAGEGWHMRYGAPARSAGDNYRMAGDDPAEAGAIAALIAGDPLDPAAERRARAGGWH